MVRHLKKTVCVLFGAVALISLTPSSGKAQHIVTENEAAKLTFESLTAKPVVYHRVKHVSSARSNVRTVSYKASKRKSSKLVRNVSYNHKAKSKVSVKSAVYNVSAHKKSTKRRHRS
ncbi:hypothetical protein [Commensalibacter oyaizuii]|uniref:Extracellular protein n=1 Tax=Commensalibacter oyaizuii TaxID=3043873 RepID=A0ABT6PZG8_9PROT|nr:hypothetical protein [Commensalibacter sp. TBRC 16381]MDI2090259.1 hypothetical protein [Commensalibacter sp. TBRC 16381]